MKILPNAIFYLIYLTLLKTTDSMRQISHLLHRTTDRTTGSCYQWTAPMGSGFVIRSTQVGWLVAGAIASISVPIPVLSNTVSYLASNYCEGRTRDGQIQGKADCQFPSGNRFVGELRNGVRQGNGVFTFANGTQCEGMFQNDLLNGRGVCVFPGGNRYEGEFRNSQRHGQGTFTFAAGGRCQGIFQNDELQGTGVCSYPSGNRYEGAFQNNKKQGRGTLTLTNGTRCEGTFNNDWLEGFAVCTYPTGMRYEGEFRAGKQSGKGAFIMPNGARVEGTWRNGKFIETKQNRLDSLQLNSPLTPTSRFKK